MDEDYLNDVKEELKRVDHLIYVSLKYSRTVDVLKSVIDRMISAFDFGFMFLFEKAKEKIKDLDIPAQPRKKCELLKNMFPEDEELQKFIEFYILLRDLSKAEYTKREEYRRHVTMIADIRGENVEVSIDTLHENYEQMNRFVEYLQEVSK